MVVRSRREILAGDGVGHAWCCNYQSQSLPTKKNRKYCSPEFQIIIQERTPGRSVNRHQLGTPPRPSGAAPAPVTPTVPPKMGKIGGAGSRYDLTHPIHVSWTALPYIPRASCYG